MKLKPIPENGLIAECGINCTCCEMDDGTVPADHEQNCLYLRSNEMDCLCENIETRKLARIKEEEE